MIRLTSALLLAACSTVTDNCPSPGFGTTTVSFESSAVVLRWTASTLPDAYYKAQLSTDDATLRAQVSSVQTTAPREIRVLFKDVAFLNGKTLALPLEFPDTEGFVTCNHPGMPDAYFVTITATFDASGSFVSGTTAQSVVKGPI